MKRTKKSYATDIIILMIFVLSTGVKAANYFVSNDGADIANGTSPETAWKTIAHVNSQTFNPGDSILFRCGDRWMEYLIVPSSGNASNYITFSSYGNGEKPKLYGSIPATSFTAHPSYSNVYRINELIDYELYYGIPGSSSRASLYFIISDSVIWGDGRLDRETSFTGLTENYKFLWQNDSVYFYYDGSINDIDTIEVTQLARGIDITKEYITIDGLNLQYFASRCIGTMNWPEVTMHGFQMRNCVLAYTASKEEAVGYGLALGFSDMIIENNISHDNGRRNISLNLVGTTGNAVMRNVIIQDNELYSGYHTTGIDMSMHSPDQQMKNITIRRNKIYDYYGGNGFQSESIFLQNYGGVAPITSYDSIYIYNNLLLNTTLDGVYLEYIGNHVYIINNTFTGAGSRAFVFTTTSNAHHTIMNNIFCNYPPSAMTSIDGASDGTTILDTCDYNLYFSASNPNGSYIWYQMYGSNYYYNNWAGVQATENETHSPTPQAPHLVDSISDLRLRSSSPAIGKGKRVSFVTSDYLGNLRDPSTPDLGAYEYNPDIPNSIENINYKNDILSLFPNPVSNNLIVDLSDKWGDNYSVHLYNVQGAKVYESEYSNSSSQTINVVKFPKGIYFLKVVSDNLEMKTAKIIIQ
jgi:hypothetical protein